MNKLRSIKLPSLRNGEHHLFIHTALTYWQAAAEAAGSLAQQADNGDESTDYTAQTARQSNGDDGQTNQAGRQLTKDTVWAAQIAGELDALTKADSEEDRAFRRKDLSRLREELQTLNAMQDKLHCSILAQVKLLARNNPVSQATPVGQSLLRIFRIHPVETLVSQKQQATMERVLISQLMPRRADLARYSPPAAEWLDRLDEVNARIARLIAELGTSRAEQSALNLRRARLASDAAYLALRRKIDSLNLIVPGNIDTEINAWNAVVDDFCETINRRMAKRKRLQYE